MHASTSRCRSGQAVEETVPQSIPSMIVSELWVVTILPAVKLADKHAAVSGSTATMDNGVLCDLQCLATACARLPTPAGLIITLLVRPSSARPSCTAFNIVEYPPTIQA